MGLISGRPIKTLAKPVVKEKKKSEPKTNIISVIQKIKLNMDRYLTRFKDDYEVIYKRDDLERFINNCEEIVAIDTETTGLGVDDRIVGICVYSPGMKAIYVPIYHVDCIVNKDIEEVASKEDIVWFVNELNKKKLVYHNAAFDLRVLKLATGVDMNYPYWDTLVGAHLSNFDKNKRGLKDQYNKYIAKDDDAFGHYSDLFEGLTLEKLPINLVYIYAARDAFMTYELYKYQKELFDGPNKEQKMVFDLEIKLTKVISEMKIEGIYFDKEYTEKMSAEMNVELKKAKEELYDLVSKNVGITFDMKQFDPNSPVKLKELLFKYMKLKIPQGETYKTVKVNEETLEKLNHPVCQKLLEYRKLFKQINTYVDKMHNVVDSDGCIHSDFNSWGAVTGRFSCISKGTKIQTTGYPKNIEDIQVGDYVYSYDENNQLSLNKVLAVMNNGVRDCIKLNWVSKYNKQLQGELICTPDHFVKTKRGWVMAKDLKPSDSIYYLHKYDGEDCFELYGTGGLGEEEHSWIKKNFFNIENTTLHIHHLDRDRHNNHPDNLVVGDAKTHNAMHQIIEFEENGIKRTGLRYNREDWIKICEDVNWELTKIPHDYGTVVDNLQFHKINYIKEYTDAYYKRPTHLIGNKVVKNRHIQLVKTHLKYALELAKNNFCEAAGYFGVTEQEFIDACEKYKLLDNHSITSIDFNWGKTQVYDLEVENTHCFIANELCVHNCSNPNFQNISNEFKSPSGKKYNIRGMFTPKPGQIWIGADYSGQEVRVAAAISKDKNLYDAFEHGKDIHAFMASLAFHRPYEECLEFRPNDDPQGRWKKGDVNKEGKAYRKKAKSVTFGLAYGTSAQGLAGTIGGTVEEAQEVMDAYFEAFPAIKDAIERAQEYGKTHGYVKTLLNRKRPIDHILEGPIVVELKENTQFNFDPDLNSKDGSNELPESKKQEIIDTYTSLKSYKDKKEYEEYLKRQNIIIRNNQNDYNSALRQCFNSWIQGTSAEQTKIALVKIFEDERLKRLGAKIILSIHDENIITVPKENAEEAAKYLEEDMIKAANEVVDIVFKSDVEFYERWY